MKTSLLIASALVLSTGAAAFAQPPAAAPAPPAAAAAAAKYGPDSSLAELLGKTETKAVLAKHMPNVVPMLEQYVDQLPAEFTLSTLLDYADQAGLTKAQYDAAVADLAKL